MNIIWLNESPNTTVPPERGLRWIGTVRQEGWIQLYSCHNTPNRATSPSKNIRHLTDLHS